MAVTKAKKRAHVRSGLVSKCGLCGKKKGLTKTPCCGNWICDDEHRYAPFSHAGNSCSRNHSRFTLCGYHAAEEHRGHWINCPECRRDFETEMYVWYGTNEYNFEKLPNPPSYEPTRCSNCGAVIILGEDEYSVKPGKHGREYECSRCMGEETKRSPGLGIDRTVKRRSP